MRFSIRATDREGKEVKIEREAPDALSLSRSLRREGLTVILATPVRANKSTWTFDGLFNRVKFYDKILLADNLGSMIAAGLSLSRALDVIERQGTNKAFKDLVKSVAERVRAGGSLRDALAEHPDVFPPLFIAMVGAGEESGKLPESLSIVAEQMNKSYELRRKIKGAMLYPAVIVCAIILIGILMMIYVVPTLTETFKELDVELPLSTRMVILFSDAVSAHPLVTLISFPLILFVLYNMWKSPRGKKMGDKLVIRLPLIGEVVRHFNSAVTMRTISSLISAGVSMLEALRITEDVLQNNEYKKVLLIARTNVEKGQALSVAFKGAESIYPVFVGEMTAVGEETGDLSAMLMKGAVFYEKEVDQVTKNLSTIIEPILMIVIGIAVGFFAIAMLTPMYSLTDAIS